MSDISNLRDTIVPKSNQLNADQLIAGPITIKITAVERKNDQQPVAIFYQDDGGRPFKPCLSMRRVMISLWGEDGRTWIGRSMTLYNDPKVQWSDAEVGGVRISHMSDIQGDAELMLTTKRGRKSKYTVRKLTVTDPTIEHRQRLQAAAEQGPDALKSAWVATPKAIREAINPSGACPDELKQMAAAAIVPAATDGGEF